MDYKFLILVALLLIIFAYLFKETETSKRDIETKFFELNENIENNSKTLRTKFQADLSACTNKIKTYNADFISQARKITFLNAQPITNMSNNYTDTDTDGKNPMQYLSDVRKQKEKGGVTKLKPDRQDSLYMSETSSKTNFKIDFNDSVVADKNKVVVSTKTDTEENKNVNVPLKGDVKQTEKTIHRDNKDHVNNDGKSVGEKSDSTDVREDECRVESEDEAENEGEDEVENEGDDEVENEGDDEVENEGDDEVENEGDDEVENEGEDEIENDGDDVAEDEADESEDESEGEAEDEAEAYVSDTVDSIEIDMSQYKTPKSIKNTNIKNDQLSDHKPHAELNENEDEDDNTSLNTGDIRALTGKAFKDIDTYTKKTLEHMAKVFSIPTTYKNKNKRFSYRKDELYDKIKAHVMNKKTSK
jgi:hypothetical protein